MATQATQLTADVESVQEIIEYQTPEADKSVLLRHDSDVGRFRVHYLKELRDKWEWVDDVKGGQPHVLLKRR